MTAFDPTKPVQTRDGRKAGIYRSDIPGRWSVHGWMVVGENSSMASSWSSTGGFSDDGYEHDSDLINIPAPPRRWLVHVLKNGEVEHCDTQRCYSRIEVIELTPAVREALKAKGLLP